MTGSETILVVDDEPAIVELMVQRLRRLGYTVTATTSSVEALSIFRRTPEAFDLVITDMTMPEMTGDKLAAALFEIKAQVGIILCTGYSSRISADRAAQIGVKALLMKPLLT